MVHWLYQIFIYMLIAIIVIFFCFFIPLLLVFPFLGSELSFFSLPFGVGYFASTSFFIGVWLFGSYSFLSKEKKDYAYKIITDSHGTESIILFIPYVIFLGSISFFKKTYKYIIDKTRVT